MDKIRNELEKRILAKEEQIKKLRTEIDTLIDNAKRLTFNEYAIADILVNLGTKIRDKQTQIETLQYEVYDLMLILKA